MTQQEFISRILAAERQAQQIYEEAAAAQQALEGNLNQEIQSLRDRYFAAADRSLDTLRTEANDAAVEQVRQLDIQLENKLSQVEQTYREHREEWIQTIFRMIVEPGLSGSLVLRMLIGISVPETGITASVCSMEAPI